MQGAWPGMALMVCVVLIGLVVSILLGKSGAQKKATGFAFISLALLLVLFYIFGIYFSMKWIIPLFVAACILVPVVVYMAILSFESRQKVTANRKNRSLEKATSPSSAVPVEKNAFETGHIKGIQNSNPSTATLERNSDAVGVGDTAPITLDKVVGVQSTRDAINQSEGLEELVSEESLAASVSAVDLVSNGKEDRRYEQITARKQKPAVQSFDEEEEYPYTFVQNETFAQKGTAEEFVTTVEDGIVSSVTDSTTAEVAAAVASFVESGAKISTMQGMPARQEKPAPQEMPARQEIPAPQEEPAPQGALANQETPVNQGIPEVGETVRELTSQKLQSEEVVAHEQYRPRYGRSDVAPRYGRQTHSERLAPAVVEPAKTAVSYESCLKKAEMFKEKGLHAVAARLYEEGSQLIDDEKHARKALFEAMGSYVKADMPNEAKNVAAILKENVNSLSPIEVMKLDTVLRMA